ncbi:unnamed protein product, partial [marine sediment metagenome]
RTGSRTVTGMAGHWFERIQWSLPTQDNYDWLRLLFNGAETGQHLRREYEHLRREYEDLRREYEQLRRPFAVSAEVPFTDVWTFPTVQARDGKHPCEKPLAMMRHIVEVSSRPGDLVLDPFAGSGGTLEAASIMGRKAIGCDTDPRYCRMVESRVRSSGRLWEHSSNGQAW